MGSFVAAARLGRSRNRRTARASTIVLPDDTEANFSVTHGLAGGARPVSTREARLYCSMAAARSHQLAVCSLDEKDLKVPTRIPIDRKAPLQGARLVRMRFCLVKLDRRFDRMLHVQLPRHNTNSESDRPKIVPAATQPR
jgi:hypothetical protein